MFSLGIGTAGGSRFSGEVRQFFCRNVIPFDGLDDAVMKMEYLMDREDGPEPGRPRRYFVPSEETDSRALAAQKQKHAEELLAADVLRENRQESCDLFAHGGDRLSFLITVNSRQNGTWQGSVTWLRGCRRNIREPFFSVLELLRLIAGAAAQTEEEAAGEAPAGESADKTELS